MMATWSAGLIIGVALLLANNPWRKVPRLSYRRLYGLLPLLVLVPFICAAILGAIGYAGWLARWSADFRVMVAQDEWRPYRFMCVFGMHLGGYIGGLLAMAVGDRRHCAPATPDGCGSCVFCRSSSFPRRLIPSLWGASLMALGGKCGYHSIRSVRTCQGGKGQIQRTILHRDLSLAILDDVQLPYRCAGRQARETGLGRAHRCFRRAGMIRPGPSLGIFRQAICTLSAVTCGRNSAFFAAGFLPCTTRASKGWS